MSKNDDAITDQNEKQVMTTQDPYPYVRVGEQKPWSDKVEKLYFGSLDRPDLTVVAQYNPKELQIDKQIQWKQPERIPGSHPGAVEDDQLELPAAPTRSMNLELMFDGFEDQRSVQPQIDLLEELSSIREPGSKHAYLRRAHHCVVAWGGVDGARRFRCVIESLSTKVTMFSPKGLPLRVTCSMKLKEVKMLAKTDAAM
jgi:hypothetical protein